MLNDLIGDSKYNGLRVHFACFLDSGSPTVKGKEGFLTVCFVPTIGSDTQIGGTDDSAQFSYIDANGNIVKDPKRTTVKPWVDHYRNHRVAELKTEGSGKVTNFDESLTLWYSRGSIRAPVGTSEKGLLDLIECLDKTTNPVVKMQIEFVAFLLGNDEPDPDFRRYRYQLSLIFDLIQKDDKVVSFGSIGDLHHLAQTDTGVPCPPLGGCPPPPAP